MYRSIFTSTHLPLSARPLFLVKHCHPPSTVWVHLAVPLQYIDVQYTTAQSTELFIEHLALGSESNVFHFRKVITELHLDVTL